MFALAGKTAACANVVVALLSQPACVVPASNMAVRFFCAHAVQEIRSSCGAAPAASAAAAAVSAAPAHNCASHSATACAERPGRPEKLLRSKPARLFSNIFEPGKTADMRVPHCVYCTDVAFATWEEAQAHQRERHPMVPSLPPVRVRASIAATIPVLTPASAAIHAATIDVAALPLRPRDARRDCPDCGHDTQRLRQAAGGSDSVSVHMQRHRTAHGTTPPLYVCSHVDPATGKACGAGFGCKNNYAKHQRIHTGEQRVPCTACGRSFSSAAALRIHMARKHPELLLAGTAADAGSGSGSGAGSAAAAAAAAAVPQHSCPLCPAAFVTAYQLRRHVRSHRKEAPYPCSAPGCGASFTTRFSQRRHEAAAHGIGAAAGFEAAAHGVGIGSGTEDERKWSVAPAQAGRKRGRRTASPSPDVGASAPACAVVVAAGLHSPAIAAAAAAAVARVRASGGAAAAAPSAAALAAAAALVSAA